ncbi:MAG: DEAD/DEAH box helicase [Lentimicrobiaceae bacterium]|nr:DEAD/DEAH box helicase [Lentimicrobiaceae bacterium]
MVEDDVLVGILKTAIPFGFTIYPYVCVQNKAGYYTVKERLTSQSKDFPVQFKAIAEEMVALSESIEPQKLVSTFSKKAVSPAVFFEKVDKKLKEEVIRTKVDKALFRMISLMQEHQLQLFDSRQMPNLYTEDQIHIYQEVAEARLKFKQTENGTLYTFEAFLKGHQVNLQHPSNIILTREPCLYISNNRLFAFDESINGKLLLPFLSKEFIEIPKRMEAQYFGTFIKKIVNRCQIEAEGFSIFESDILPQARLLLENDWQGKTGLILMFGYGEKQLLANYPQQVITELSSDKKGFVFHRLHRKSAVEKQKIEFLKSLGLLQFESVFRLNSAGGPATIFDTVNWIIQNRQILAVHGFEIIQPGEEKYCFEPVSFKASLQTDNDWYDLNAIVQTGAFSIPFYKFREHILSNRKAYLLPDGAYFVIPDTWFSRYREVMLFARIRNEKLSLQKHHYRLLRGFNFPEIDDLISNETHQESFTLPPLQNVSLRPYQIYGFGWMKRLGRQGFGCLLADDMGLGKTLQIIALLVSYYEPWMDKNSCDDILLPAQSKGNGTQLDLFGGQQPAGFHVIVPKPQVKVSSEKHPCSLVVMPASLIHNWRYEIMRFAPGLKVYVHTGAGRKLSADVLKRNNIILTTYGTLRNDIGFLEGYKFGYVILDESQNIKNALSKTATAAFRLNAYFRVALTGTPVENSLTDLWSQMDFLNRGLLGSLHDFTNHYAAVLADNPEHEIGADLLKIIEPFLLRRTKEEVAADLPPVSETVSFCNMDDGQQKMYEREKSKIRNYFLSGGDDINVENPSVMVLRALMQLRQIANHPKLVDASLNTGSGKFDEVTEKLQTVLAENHRILVFSSFVKHLKLIETWCNDMGIRYALLTGSTHKREKVVNEFKADKSIRLFLISLKAGGVGLNLAEAGYVFILDPWWNPAAEMQAVSRAHRIGQDKNVFVYRFITKDTVEEKILRLQERKTSLAQAFVKANSALSGLSASEVMEMFE